MPNTGDVRYITNGGKLLTSTLGYLPSQYKKVTWNGSGWIDSQGNNVTVNGRGVDNNTGDLIAENNTGVNVDTNTGTNVDTNIDADTNTEVKKPVKASDIVKIPETRRLPTKNTRRKFVPTYVAPDGKTYTGMTQDQFNQRMQEYQMEDAIIADNKARQQALRSQTVGNGDVTRDQIFKDALNKFAENPDGFTAEQRTALYNAGKQLGYYNDTMLDAQAQTPAQTAPSVIPQNTANTTVAGTQADAQQQTQAQSQSNNNVKQGGGSNFIWYV